MMGLYFESKSCENCVTVDELGNDVSNCECLKCFAAHAKSNCVTKFCNFDENLVKMELAVQSLGNGELTNDAESENDTHTRSLTTKERQKLMAKVAREVFNRKGKALSKRDVGAALFQETYLGRIGYIFDIFNVGLPFKILLKEVLVSDVVSQVSNYSSENPAISASVGSHLGRALNSCNMSSLVACRNQFDSSDNKCTVINNLAACASSSCPTRSVSDYLLKISSLICNTERFLAEEELVQSLIVDPLLVPMSEEEWEVPQNSPKTNKYHSFTAQDFELQVEAMGEINVGESVCELEEFDPALDKQSCDKRELNDCFKEAISELYWKSDSFCPYCQNDNAYDECRCACCIGKYIENVCINLNCDNVWETTRFSRFVYETCSTRPVKQYRRSLEEEEGSEFDLFQGLGGEINAASLSNKPINVNVGAMKDKAKSSLRLKKPLGRVYRRSKDENDEPVFEVAGFPEIKPYSLNTLRRGMFLGNRQKRQVVDYANYVDDIIEDAEYLTPPSSKNELADKKKMALDIGTRDVSKEKPTTNTSSVRDKFYSSSKSDAKKGINTKVSNVGETILQNLNDTIQGQFKFRGNGKTSFTTKKETTTKLVTATVVNKKTVWFPSPTTLFTTTTYPTGLITVTSIMTISSNKLTTTVLTTTETQKEVSTASLVHIRVEKGFAPLYTLNATFNATRTNITVNNSTIPPASTSSSPTSLKSNWKLFFITFASGIISYLYFSKSNLSDDDTGTELSLLDQHEESSSANTSYATTSAPSSTGPGVGKE